MKPELEAERALRDARDHKKMVRFHRAELKRAMERYRRLCEEHHIQFVGVDDTEESHGREAPTRTLDSRT